MFEVTLEGMISHYKNNGERVDEVLYSEVMKVVEREQEWEGICKSITAEWRDGVLENKRLREALEEITSWPLGEGNARENYIIRIARRSLGC